MNFHKDKKLSVTSETKVSQPRTQDARGQFWDFPGHSGMVVNPNIGGAKFLLLIIKIDQSEMTESHIFNMSFITIDQSWQKNL